MQYHKNLTVKGFVLIVKFTVRYVVIQSNAL